MASDFFLYIDNKQKDIRCGQCSVGDLCAFLLVNNKEGGKTVSLYRVPCAIDFNKSLSKVEKKVFYRASRDKEYF